MALLDVATKEWARHQLVGIGTHRWPTFNVADICVSIGAALLAWTLWQEDDQTRDRKASG